MMEHGPQCCCHHLSSSGKSKHFCLVYVWILLDKAFKTRIDYSHLRWTYRPPLWYSGQSSWLQIRRPGFDSRHYQKKEVVGLERGPLSLVEYN
jgi:hypothetical protein